MTSADDAGGYDCARPVGVVAGAGQVGAVGLVGPDERGGAQDCHLDGGGGIPQELSGCALAFWLSISQPSREVESCALDLVTLMRRALNSCSLLMTIQ